MNSNELIRKICEAQKCISNIGDCINLVEENRDRFDMSKTDEFRLIVKKKIQAHELQYLNNLDESNSKSEEIVNHQFKKMEYFSDKRFSKENMKLLFSLRTKMFDCKSNFVIQYENDMSCIICKDSEKVNDEDHILTCTVLNDAKYEVRFSDVY